MSQKTKSFFAYTLILIILAALVVSGYFHETISKYINVPDYYWLIFPLFCSVVIILFLWSKEQHIEKEKYEFVSIATHKFRTPLSGIKWAIERMEGELTHEEKNDILKKLRSAVEYLIEIVDLLVDFAKVDTDFALTQEAVSIRDLIEESLTKFGLEIRTRSTDISVETEPNLPLIVIDRRKIQFVVDMLIDNAIKYTPAQGKVMITVNRSGRGVLLCVRDTGIGISRQDLRNLFTKFYRGANARNSHTEGMGLGLYAAKHIVDGHGGKLWAESEGVNKGTKMCMYLNMGKMP